jgi:cytochrome c-type biogenesis protein CcmH
MVGFLLLIVLVLAGVGVTGLGASDPPDRQALAIASELRCPSCDGVSVADSPSPIARAIYGRITRELQQGRDPKQIKADLVASYGGWIVTVPSRRGLGVLPWLAPVAVAAGAGVWLFLDARARKREVTE